MKNGYRKTIFACFLAYIVQSVVNNFVPLLFVTFHKSMNISMDKITALITINFLIQLIIDAASARFIDKIGYRASIITADVFSAAGLVSIAFLPTLLPDPFSGLVVSVGLYAVGGGLAEVLVSPIVEAVPSDNKEKTMSLLHSFYCWGHMGVVLISTAFFALFGISNWRVLALIWALLPVVNAVIFTKVPMVSLSEERGETSVKKLFSNKLFWLFLIMMLCAGASEQAVSQWASAFAEKGLGVSKTAGDLLGPTMFACMMGLSRVWFGKCGEKLNLDRFIKYSSILCIASYAMVAFVPSATVGLIGCAVCGFSVGIFWPGTYSKAAASLKSGGTAMFALLALAGDIGCVSGPTLVGLVSSRFGDNLHIGMAAALAFPLCMLIISGLPTHNREKNA